MVSERSHTKVTLGCLDIIRAAAKALILDDSEQTGGSSPCWKTDQDLAFPDFGCCEGIGFTSSGQRYLGNIMALKFKLNTVTATQSHYVMLQPRLYMRL